MKKIREKSDGLGGLCSAIHVDAQRSTGSRYQTGRCNWFYIQKKQMAITKWEEYKKSLIYYAVTGKIDCRNEVI